MDVNLRIAGQAGQGLESIGGLLVDTFAGMGHHVFSIQSYMSRIRGGLNWYDIRVGDGELFSGRPDADLLVALTKEALSALRSEVVAGGRILFNGATEDAVIGVEFEKIAQEIAGSKIMANACLLYTSPSPRD